MQLLNCKLVKVILWKINNNFVKDLNENLKKYNSYNYDFEKKNLNDNSEEE